MKKRAQASGAGAATLVAIIAGLIVLYILFVPPETREKILEGDYGDSLEEEEEAAENITRLIVLEHPGALTEVEDLKIKDSLPSVYLASVYETQAVDTKNTVYVRNSLFNEQLDTFDFELDSENTKNAILSFNVKKAEGRLVIKLNGNVIFNSEITQPSIEPIPLPAKYLEDFNTLEFRVSGSFFGANEYMLDKAKVTADIKDVGAQSAVTTFLVTTDELLNMDKVTLTYYPDCSPGEVNPLDITLNGRLLVSSIPDCGSLHKKEFLPDRLVTGENELVFKTTKGSYLMRDLSVTKYLEEPSYPSYYFELDKEQLKEINKTSLNMSFKFLTADFKNLEVSVNGATVFIDTKEKVYSEEISSLVRKGTNAIKITPKSSGIDILDFKVAIVEED
ncbi:cellulose biosynthesis cyclic di-GMP-binding regulatory protein BcsB [Candidatus Woesearchaeota archaeon]|nr:cellulose biosynthesis cyclic di-GMP-binding regulatory protein BcsB [Candidatus Woesearchaeota archaeon]